MTEGDIIAEVAVSGLAYSFDRRFDYLLPPELAGVRPGCRVTVGFGQADSRRTAMVLSLRRGDGGALKSVRAAVDAEPIVGEELLKIAEAVAERTFSCLYDAIKLTYPAGLEYVEKIRYKATDKPYLSGDEPGRSVLAFLGGRCAEARAIEKATGADSAALDALTEGGWLERSGTQRRRTGDDMQRTLRLAAGGGDGKRLTDRQKAALDYITLHGETAAKELTYYTGATAAITAALEKRGFLETGSRESYRGALADAEAGDSPDNYSLNESQQAAFEKLDAMRSGGGKALLYGVTGSGKTMVLLKLAQRTLESGKGAILMVPEILLTPQFVKLFSACFGSRVAVIHSALADGVRLDEYKRIKSGRADLVIGTRSAVFAPVKNLGLISMDEEQESAYKSESSPRYDAGDVAAMRSAYNKALFLRMSATPSVKTRYAAERGKCGYVTLDGRFGRAKLPEVEVVDMCEEQPVLPGGVIGPTLHEKLAANLRDGHQAVLLLNRRGHDTVVICYDCGEVLKCPKCSVALNYHSANRRLMCHYCGYSTDEIVCPSCGSRKMRYFGSGTQKLEEELAALLPDAKTLRMDTDTTMTKDSHDRLFRDFAGGEYDLLVGTQMVAKGLDFENVTLAGVLNAEQGLFSGDFKGAERTFSLLTQVVGRCGRGRYPGEAVIQTYLPEHRILEFAKNQDYEGFYRDELALRKQMLYPPFCDVCLIGFSGPDSEKTEAAANEFSARLRAAVTGTDLPLRAYGPAPAHTARINGRWRWRLTLKCRNDAALRAVMAELLREFAKKHARDEIAAFADMDNELYY